MTAQDWIDKIMSRVSCVKSVWYGRLADCVQEGEDLPPVPSGHPTRQEFIAFAEVNPGEGKPSGVVVGAFSGRTPEEALQYLAQRLTHWVD